MTEILWNSILFIKKPIMTTGAKHLRHHVKLDVRTIYSIVILFPAVQPYHHHAEAAISLTFSVNYGYGVLM